MTDMTKKIFDELKKRPLLKDVTIKPFYRPEALQDNQPSIVIVPMAPAQQRTFGSDEPLRKRFDYQMNVEASTKDKTSQYAREVEKTLLELGFFQLNGGIDDYFRETKRYVDARRYRGHSNLYDVDY